MNHCDGPLPQQLLFWSQFKHRVILSLCDDLISEAHLHHFLNNLLPLKSQYRTPHLSSHSVCLRAAVSLPVSRLTPSAHPAVASLQSDRCSSRIKDTQSFLQQVSQTSCLRRGAILSLSHTDTRLASVLCRFDGTLVRVSGVLKSRAADRSLCSQCLQQLKPRPQHGGAGFSESV